MKTNIFRFIFFIAVVAMMSSQASTQSKTRTHVYTYGESKKKGYLGVQLEDVTKRLKEKKNLTVDAGAYVQEVVEESPAEKAGIEAGDVITKFDDREIKDSDDLVKAVQRAKPGADVKLELTRKAERKTLTALIDRAPRGESYSYNFRMPRLATPPRAPRMPHGFTFTMSNEFHGLEVQELGKQLAEYFQAPNGRGVLASAVERGSSADRAGIKAGDVLVKVGGVMIRDVDDLREAVDDARAGKEVACDVIRQGKSVSLTWKIDRDDDEEGEDDDDGAALLGVDDPCITVSIEASQEELSRMPKSQIDELKAHLRKIEVQLKDKVAEIKSIIHNHISLFWQLSNNV